jgi:hypothetical protein
VDIGFLVFLRVCLGAMMLWTIWGFYDKELIASLYIRPAFHFSYHGFSWLRPWPGDGMYVHFAALAALSVFVMVGCLHRLSVLLLFLGFGFVFLLEKAVYLNHYYLMCLLCLLFVFLPAHRAWSIDVLLRPRIKSETVPAWTLWLLRFQIGLPYVYGAIAKLKGDWLQGQPMQIWLSKSVWRELLGPVAEEHWLALVFSWGGLIFDACVVPALLWKRTRPYAFAAVVVFHLLNAFMFDIGVFPWLMIGTTTVFFAPDWPKRLITPPHSGKASDRNASDPPKSPPLITQHPATVTPPTLRQLLVASLLGLYVLFHLVVPFRRCLYPGSVLWTEQGQLFAWHMMLRDKVNAVRFIVTDPSTGQLLPADIRNWLSPQQIESMGHDPEMMREFAHVLRRSCEDKGQDVEVRVLALCSLNGRKPQPLIDPRVDLSRQPRSLLHQAYIIPLREPLRRQPWNIPVAEWEKHLFAPQNK